MAKRKNMSKKKSKKLFTNTAKASKVKNINYKPAPMRGGYRL